MKCAMTVAMKVPTVPLLTACFAAFLTSAQAAPKTFQAPGVTFTYDDTLLKSPKLHHFKAVALASPTDIPDGVAPAHVAVEFAHESGGIEVFPTSDPGVKDFAKAYPTHAHAEKELRRVLRERPAESKELPVLPWADVDMPFHKKIHYLDFRNGSGVAWLSQRTIDIAPINNAQLWYIFQGLTRDGAHYVAAQMRVAHPSLPATAVVKDYADFEKQYPAYLARASSKLGAQPDNSFRPSLSALQSLFASITVTPAR